MVNGDVRMKVTVEYPQHVIHNDTDERSDNQTTLGFCLVARPITWQQLDKKIQTLFEVGTGLPSSGCKDHDVEIFRVWRFC